MAHTNTDETKRIALGSGNVYIMEFTGEIPSDAIIETAVNKLGAVQGGATVEYKPKYYTASSDDGAARKTILTEEEASMKLGFITWNADKLKTLCNTGRTTEVGSKRTIKIGGLANYDGKKYLFRFVHKDSYDGDCRLTIVGSNQAGFSLAYVKDKETTLNPEITCEPMDNEGTLIIYEEEVLAVRPLTITAAHSELVTSITIAETLGAGNTFRYVVGAAAVGIKSGDAGLSSLGTAYPTSGNTITGGTSGQIVTVFELSSTEKLVGYGTAVIPA